MTVQNASFLHSIYLYNGSMDRFYSTYQNLYFEDSTARDLVSIDSRSNKNKFITRDIKEGNTPQKVFSLVIYDSLNSKQKPEGAVIINVSSQWLFDNINYLNQLGNENFDNIYLVDEKERILFTNTGQNDKDGVMDYLAEVKWDKGEMAGDYDVLNQVIQGKEYRVSYMKIEKTDWHILKVQEYSDFYQFIKKLKTSIVVIALVFIILTVIVSLMISGKIYRPIGLLVKEVKNELLPEHERIDEGDEISLLRNIYRKSKDEINLYKRQLQSNEQILKKYYFCRMLLDSRGISESEWKDIEQFDDISVNFDSKFAVCVIRIDNYKDFCTKYNYDDRQLYKFSIGNIIAECYP